jgi:hypothetical protein
MNHPADAIASRAQRALTQSELIYQLRVHAAGLWPLRPHFDGKDVGVSRSCRKRLEIFPRLPRPRDAIGCGREPGHRTRFTFKRYNTTCERNLRKAARKLVENYIAERENRYRNLSLISPYHS